MRRKEMITIKSEKEIRLMREAGKILGEVHNRLGEIIEPGISTLEIDRKGEEWIRGFGCIPSFLNYEGYPASICVSLDDEVVHGIPKENVILREGDIVSLDAGVIYQGYHSDAASHPAKTLLIIATFSEWRYVSSSKVRILCTILIISYRLLD